MTPEDPATLRLTVPGWTGSGPGHWQTWWERALPGTARVEQEDWERPDRERWVAALGRAAAGCPTPPVLLAHSLGCLAVVHHAAAAWERGGPPPVAGALLIAPADVEEAAGLEACASFAPIPRERLPFPSLLVASRTDPYLTFPRARRLAADWGSVLVDAGDAGHLDTAAGYGPWPEGLALLRELETMVSRHPQR